jgi:F-type H+/Na+-transporting ATPase subunit beta
MNIQTSSANLGAINSEQGRVVDIRFDGCLAPVRALLHTGKDGCVAIKVPAQPDAQRMCGIALTSTEGKARRTTGLTIQENNHA